MRRIKLIVKDLFPVFIRIYLLDEEDNYREMPSSTESLKVLLAENKDLLADRLLALFTQHWPAEASELASRTAIEADNRPGSRRIGDRPQAAASTAYLGQINPCRSARRKMPVFWSVKKNSFCGGATNTSTRF